MLTPERQELILSHLNDRSYVSIRELVKRLHFSEEGFSNFCLNF